MKKFSFLIPVTTAVAALTGQAEAKIVDTTPTANEVRSATAQSVQTGITEKLYVKDGELHSLMMKPSVSGQMLAWHSSHASHASHESHSSHYSHRSGY